MCKHFPYWYKISTMERSRHLKALATFFGIVFLLSVDARNVLHNKNYSETSESIYYYEKTLNTVVFKEIVQS